MWLSVGLHAFELTHMLGGSQASPTPAPYSPCHLFPRICRLVLLLMKVKEGTIFVFGENTYKWACLLFPLVPRAEGPSGCTKRKLTGNSHFGLVSVVSTSFSACGVHDPPHATAFISIASAPEQCAPKGTPMSASQYPGQSSLQGRTKGRGTEVVTPPCSL